MAQEPSNAAMSKAYDPKAVEGHIYDLWMNGGYFTPEVDPGKEPFVIIMPPPNVTGELHLGHALTTAVEDLMVRWHRMKGEPTLFLPGTDHAGIATQVVVERMLADDGISRHDIGRRDFVRHVWDWVDRYGDRIHEQIKRLGASCDWSRLAFTLDEGPNRAVRTTFVNLYKKGLIYRGERITNWCPRCTTALSDLEVVHQEESSSLYHVQYRLEDGGDGVVVATTRPETMLGDTGVAVHPDDSRYKGLVGANVILPIMDRAIPVVADDAVDPEFGTGALKVTPGHDAADFEIGRRHALPAINVLNDDGTLNENAGPYAGVDRVDARARIVEQLENKGLLEAVEPYRHSVGHCQRCSEVVEPIVSLQWYMKMGPLAEPARRAVAEGKIKIVPDRFAKVYFNWMDNIRDWCISRQLWWGHRIPVWYCDRCSEVIVETDDPSSCPACGGYDLSRDEDVLDTWFSSGLWPHSTLGWPEETADLDYFYPGSVMETGHDILFFWVARMIFFGIENVGDIPFHTVYLHGMVRDPEGVKMSKLLGNVMDPLDLIDTYGADALRFALTIGTSAGNDMRLNEKKIEASRNFANKLWNAARFVLSNAAGDPGIEQWRDPKPSHREDRWILSRLNRTVTQTNWGMQEYQFGEAQRAAHDFLWNEYCDWYLEMAKIRLRSGDRSPVATLVHVLERTLRLLHPFMPFITEEIWQTLAAALPDRSELPEALVIAAFPEADPALDDEQAETEIGAVIELVRSVRNLRAEFRIQPHVQVEAVVDAPSWADVLQGEIDAVKTLARVGSLDLDNNGERPSQDDVVLVLSQGTVKVPLGGLVDLDQVRVRLQSELAGIDANALRLRSRLGDTRFVERAPEEVVERERQRLRDLEDRQSRLSDVLGRMIQS